MMLLAQKTFVRGTITDADSGEPIPFCNVVFQRSISGTISDINGVFFLESQHVSDSLVASCLGYSPKALPVKKETQQIPNFQGFFLYRIPLLRWLKLREVISGKILIGRLSSANRNVMHFPEGLTPLTKPYAEASIGVENILNLIRIDAMWRFSYLEHPNI